MKVNLKDKDKKYPLLYKTSKNTFKDQNILKFNIYD